MRISILGAGSIGLATAIKWRAAGHEITFGVRDVQSQSAYEAIGEGFSVLPFQDAMANPEVVLFAVGMGKHDYHRCHQSGEHAH
ncbi:MAG TPA: hypothetical protein DHW15_10360 [Bacteroidetes bacterium]|jgi:predicted dinucleotide-binding enzyme|nr:hypothetical protein [Bacteroidota bacterium]